MPFLKRGCPITRFRLLEQPSRETLQHAAEHLARHGFRPIDTLPDEMSAGWVSMDDPTDSEWRTATPDRLAHLVWTLRMDKRTVPAQLLEVRSRLEIKKFLERRKAEIQEKVLIPFANKDEKKEIKERVRLSLMSQAAPVPTMADVVWIYPSDGKQAEIWLCSTAPATVDRFRFLFKKTFCLAERPIFPFTPRPDGPDDWPENIGNRFLTWLYEHDGHSLDVLGTDVAVNFERLTISDDAKGVTIQAVVGETDPAEVKDGIGNGMLVRECDLLLGITGDAYKVRVKGADFAMRVETTFWTMDREDPDGSFADKVLSVERLFHIWDMLYRLWLIQAEWLSDSAPTWENTLDAALGRSEPDTKGLGKTADGSVKLRLKDTSTLTVIKGGK